MSFGECDDHRGQYINECVGCLKEQTDNLLAQIRSLEAIIVATEDKAEKQRLEIKSLRGL